MIRLEPHRPEATDTLSRALSCLPPMPAQTSTGSAGTPNSPAPSKLSRDEVNSHD